MSWRQAADPTASLMAFNLVRPSTVSFHRPNVPSQADDRWELTFQPVIPARAFGLSNILRLTMPYQLDGRGDEARGGHPVRSRGLPPGLGAAGCGAGDDLRDRRRRAGRLGDRPGDRRRLAGVEEARPRPVQPERVWRRHEGQPAAADRRLSARRRLGAQPRRPADGLRLARGRVFVGPDRRAARQGRADRRTADAICDQSAYNLRDQDGLDALSLLLTATLLVPSR